MPTAAVPLPAAAASSGLATRMRDAVLVGMPAAAAARSAARCEAMPTLLLPLLPAPAAAATVPSVVLSATAAACWALC